MKRSKSKQRRWQYERTRQKRRWREAGYLWMNVGGGTCFGVPGRKRFPSDTQWENLKTGKHVLITCTIDTYLGLLRGMYKARSLREITRLPGIGKVEKLA